MNVRLLNGDCLVKLKELDENSVDSIVTDPPYELGFMGKGWDSSGIAFNVDVWKECLRVLKPGGHILAFGGTRTYHRMTVAIEDAGFEIRDCIAWMYGSGFPKSHNVGNAIDKLNGAGNRGHAISSGNRFHPTTGEARPNGEKLDKYEARTEQGKGWEGWGTALKPAFEPVVMGRKPFKGTVAQNVLENGVGGLNIDGCRVSYQSEADEKSSIPGSLNSNQKNSMFGVGEGHEHNTLGRFPANVILECTCDKVIEGEKGEIKYSSGSRDNLDLTHPWGYKDIQRTNYTDTGNIHTDPNCPCYILDQQSGTKTSIKRGSKYNKNYDTTNSITGLTPPTTAYSDNNTYGDTGGASRFFYCPKTSKTDRNEGLEHLEDKQRPGQTDKGNYSSSVYCKDCGKTHNGTNDHSNCSDDVEYRPSTTTTKNIHPTVKPTDLMSYLIRLVTPKGGVVLDPFMGSGSTGKGAVREGMDFIGIEREEEYYQIAQSRIEWEQKKNNHTKWFE